MTPVKHPDNLAGLLPTAWPVPLTRRRAALRALGAPHRFVGAVVGTVTALLCGVLGLISLLGLSSPANAQPAPMSATLPLDPTRPFTPPAATTAALAATTRRVDLPAVVPPPPLRLQTIQMPQQGRPSAIVNGRLVSLGDRLGDATVASIDAQGLTLHRAKGGTQRLSLYTGVVITPSLDTATKASPSATAKHPS